MNNWLEAVLLYCQWCQCSFIVSAGAVERQYNAEGEVVASINSTPAPRAHHRTDLSLERTELLSSKDKRRYRKKCKSTSKENCIASTKVQLDNAQKQSEQKLFILPILYATEYDNQPGSKCVC